DEEKLRICLLRPFRTFADEALQEPAILREGGNHAWKTLVARERQLRDGEVAAGAARGAGHKDGISVLRAVDAPFEVIGAGCGTAVFVCAHEADVVIKTGEIKVVRITTELRHVHFGREDQ